VPVLAEVKPSFLRPQQRQQLIKRFFKDLLNKHNRISNNSNRKINPYQETTHPAEQITSLIDLLVMERLVLFGL
jgi:uncharacterized protein (UPF0305 family)